MKLIIRKFYIMELCQVEILYDVRFNWSDNYFRHRVEYLRKKTRADNSDTCQNLQWQNLGRAEIVWIPAKFLIHLMMQENLWKNKARVRQLIKFKIAFCVSQFHMAVEANFLIISWYPWLKAMLWLSTVQLNIVFWLQNLQYSKPFKALVLPCCKTFL